MRNRMQKYDGVGNFWKFRTSCAECTPFHIIMKMKMYTIPARTCPTLRCVIVHLQTNNTRVSVSVVRAISGSDKRSISAGWLLFASQTSMRMNSDLACFASLSERHVLTLFSWGDHNQELFNLKQPCVCVQIFFCCGRLVRYQLSSVTKLQGKKLYSVTGEMRSIVLKQSHSVLNRQEVEPCIHEWAAQG